ncbi:MAG: CCDC90 family protein [Zoogloeaceae bacterium]|nr:CCDC90 family protein [Zoogloeaceae bacterium]
MSSITFDTLQVVKKLETKGFDQNQAEGISDALKDVLQTADIATKSDINLVDKQLSEAATKGDLEKVRAELKIDIEKIRAELIKWYVGIAAAQIIGLGYIILRATGKA